MTDSLLKVSLPDKELLQWNALWVSLGAHYLFLFVLNVLFQARNGDFHLKSQYPGRLRQKDTKFNSSSGNFVT